MNFFKKTQKKIENNIELNPILLYIILIYCTNKNQIKIIN